MSTLDLTSPIKDDALMASIRAVHPWCEMHFLNILFEWLREMAEDSMKTSLIFPTILCTQHAVLRMCRDRELKMDPPLNVTSLQPYTLVISMLFYHDWSEQEDPCISWRMAHELIGGKAFTEEELVKMQWQFFVKSAKMDLHATYPPELKILFMHPRQDRFLTNIMFPPNCINENPCDIKVQQSWTPFTRLALQEPTVQIAHVRHQLKQRRRARLAKITVVYQNKYKSSREAEQIKPMTATLRSGNSAVCGLSYGPMCRGESPISVR